MQPNCPGRARRPAASGLGIGGVGVGAAPRDFGNGVFGFGILVFLSNVGGFVIMGFCL